MISKMAMEDIEALRADGIDVPPREVVRLNALGLKVERGARSAATWELPRVAFVGDAVLHEPTIGAEFWLACASETFVDMGDETLAMLRVLSLVMPWQELPPPSDMRAVRDAMTRNLACLDGVTFRQLANAVAYCVDGSFHDADERAEPKEDGDKDDADENVERMSLAYGLFNRGVALKLGTAADLKAMPLSALAEIVDKENAADPDSRKERKSNALGDYLRTLEAVKAAARAANENGSKGEEKLRDEAEE